MAGRKRKRIALPVADPSTASATVLDEVAAMIAAGTADDLASHSARLLARGMPQVAQKFGEEAVELVVALMREDKLDLIGESADVLYHLLVAWQASGIAPAEVWAELQRRKELSAMIEDASEVDKDTLRLALGTSKLPV
jgi:phosphoribosyl-ATP pyrophosphohydrolase